MNSNLNRDIQKPLVAQPLAQLQHRYPHITLSKGHKCALSDCQSTAKLTVFPAQTLRV